MTTSAEALADCKVALSFVPCAIDSAILVSSPFLPCLSSSHHRLSSSPSISVMPIQLPPKRQMILLLNIDNSVTTSSLLPSSLSSAASLSLPHCLPQVPLLAEGGARLNVKNKKHTDNHVNSFLSTCDRKRFYFRCFGRSTPPGASG